MNKLFAVLASALLVFVATILFVYVLLMHGGVESVVLAVIIGVVSHSILHSSLRHVPIGKVATWIFIGALTVIATIIQTGLYVISLIEQTSGDVVSVYAQPSIFQAVLVVLLIPLGAWISAYIHTRTN